MSMSYTRLLCTICLATLLLLSQLHPNSASPSFENALTHPQGHGNEARVRSSAHKLSISIKRRSRNTGIVRRTNTTSVATDMVIPNSVRAVSGLGLSVLFSLLFV
ncbi:hypothetical protein QQ045_001849 [Rhodiola kirilowii]